MNDYKIYVVNFLAANVNFPAFHQYLNDSVEILAYWNYIPAVYCVKSKLDATSLRDKLRPFLPETMLVAEIDPLNMNGYMANAEVWSWFFAPAPERKPSLPFSWNELIAPKKLT